MTINGFKNIIAALTKGCKCEIGTSMFDSFDFVTKHPMRQGDSTPSCYVLMIGDIMGTPTMVKLSMIDDSIIEESMVMQGFNPSDKEWVRDWDEFIDESGVDPMEARCVSREKFYNYRHRIIEKD